MSLNSELAKKSTPTFKGRVRQLLNPRRVGIEQSQLQQPPHTLYNNNSSSSSEGSISNRSRRRGIESRSRGTIPRKDRFSNLQENPQILGLGEVKSRRSSAEKFTQPASRSLSSESSALEQAPSSEFTRSLLLEKPARPKLENNEFEPESNSNTQENPVRPSSEASAVQQSRLSTVLRSQEGLRSSAGLQSATVPSSTRKRSPESIRTLAASSARKQLQESQLKPSPVEAALLSSTAASAELLSSTSASAALPSATQKPVPASPISISTLSDNKKSISTIHSIFNTNAFFEDCLTIPTSIINNKHKLSLDNIISSSIGLNNSNQKYIIKNIISNILNKKNISVINVGIMEGLINQLMNNSHTLEIKYYSMILFIIDKICISKLDTERCHLLNHIMTKADTITELKDYISVIKRGTTCI